MEIKSFTFNPFQENTYVVYNAKKEAVIIDPGCYERFEEEELTIFISENNLNVLAILNTHCHLDHVFGNQFCMQKYTVDILAHKEEEFTLSLAEKSALMYGIPGLKISPNISRYIVDKEIIQLGDLQFEVIFAPGHAVGHVAFYNAENNLCIAGDILFKGSFGRPDLPGGDIQVLKKSITQRMFTLPENTVIYSGHGPTTTIREEKFTNPILHY